MRRLRSRALWALTGCAAVAFAASSAGAAPSGTDIALNIGADASNERPTLIPSGGTATVTSRKFYAFLDISLNSLTPGRAKARVELGGGLTWGADDPDPAEQCTSTPTTGECEVVDLQPIAGRSESGWFWDVVAPGNGTYTYKAEIIETGDADPDTSNNASQITIVVNEQTGGGSGGGSGGGGGGGSSAAATASAVKLSPTKPKAGSTVVASVRVTKGGSPVRPSGIACAASIGKAKVKGAPKSASGVASCLFKTPKSAKGRSLSGSVSFRAGGASFTKRFMARLG